MEDIIRFDSVSKLFGHETVLKNINVQFGEGKIHGLIGRNGSGKTVLLKCICGFILPTSGTVRVRGKIVGKEVQIPPGLGGIIENPGFLPNYSGYRNLAFLAGIRGRIGKEAIHDCMIRLGLDPGCKKHVGKYSLGMRQRLGIAQAIMEDPSLILLDEPMNGLDNAGVIEMRDLFKRLRDAGKTIILATHNMQDIDELCDSVYEMEAGVLTCVRS